MEEVGNVKTEQKLNAVKQNFESTKCFQVSECKRVKFVEVDLLAHLSSIEHSDRPMGLLFTDTSSGSKMDLFDFYKKY